MFMAIVMLSSLVSLGAIPEKLVPGGGVSQEVQAAAPTINMGDYVQFGKYNSAPILWRVIHTDPTTGDPVLLSDRILTIKAFDAKGSYHTADANRESNGSNYYQDSNIRQWLNSSSLNSGDYSIDWTQNNPTAANMHSGYNAYNTEKGFLADGNFTSLERGLIKPYTHKVVVASVDSAKKDGGTLPHAYFSETMMAVKNYDTTAFFQNVTDSIFLLSVKQLKEWVYDKSATLGANYLTAKPTAEAVTQSTYISGGLTSGSNWPYWLNSSNAGSSNSVRNVNTFGMVFFNNAYVDVIGVRPAMRLNLASAILSTGSGTSGSPYVYTANQAPTDIILTAGSIAENGASGSSVGTLSATDANAGDTAAYTLVSGTGDTDNASFTIDGTALKTAASFDYEAKASYSIRVRVTDSGNATYEKALTISVSDVNETPVYQSMHLSADAKTLSFAFDQTLASADKTKLTIFNATKTALAGTAYNATASGKLMNITFVDTKATFKSLAKITIAADAVIVSAGSGAPKGSALIAEKTLDTTKFVKLSGTTMNNTNTEATLTFATTGKSGSLGAIALNPALANLSGQVETSTDSGKTWSSANFETATLSGSTLKVTFKSAVTNSKTIVRVKAGALSFTATGKANGNLNAEAKSPALELFPLGVSASLSADNKTLTVTYSEPIKNASINPDKTKLEDDLKNKLTISTTDPVSYGSIGANDKVSVKGSTLSVTFAAGLTSSSINLKVADGAVEDVKKNDAHAYTTETLVADTTGPIVTGVGYASGKVTVFFNENIALNGTTTLATLASSIKYVTTATDLDFIKPTVALKANMLTITHSTPAITSAASVKKVTFAAGLLKDVAGNPNLIVSDSPVADGAGPIAVSHALSGDDKEITVKFDESITTVAKSVPLSAISITTGSGQSTVTKPITDLIWKTATTSVTITGSLNDSIKISGLKVALSNGDKVTIAANAVQDGVLNKNAKVEVTVDTVAPTLTNLAAGTLTTTSATFTFDASEVGTYLYVGYTEANTPVTPPTASQIYSLIQTGLVDYLGGAAITASGAQTVLRSNLTAQTTYNFYVVILDNGGNFSNVETVNFTTAAP
jgi:hypothetical protein